MNFFSAEFDPVYFLQVETVEDIANSIWQLNEQLELRTIMRDILPNIGGLIKVAVAMLAYGAAYEDTTSPLPSERRTTSHRTEDQQTLVVAQGMPPPFHPGRRSPVR